MTAKRLLTVFFGTAIFNALTLLLVVNLKTYPITPTDNYANVCAITSYSETSDGGASGAGVLIDPTHVITNRHVVDRNYSSVIEDDEVSIACCFYDKSGIVNVIPGRVVSIAEPGFIFFSFDIALIELDEPMPCSTRIATSESYNNIEICREVYAIGCPAGRLPPHPTWGIRGPDINYFYDSAGISIYYGNSGGGIFDASSGELIGLTTHLGLDNDNPTLRPGDKPQLIPSYTEYLKADRLRDFISLKLPPKPPKNYSKQVASTIYIAVLLALTIAFRRHLFS
jgi:hypothetical protein